MVGRSLAFAASAASFVLACGNTSSRDSSFVPPPPKASDAGTSPPDDAAPISNGGDDPGSFGGLDGDAGAPQRPDAGDCTHTFHATIRDFKPSTEGGHPDFEAFGGSGATLDLVKTTLGPDEKPQFASTGQSGNPMLTGKAEFEQWYNDVPGVNVAIPIELPLLEDPPGSGIFVYTADEFYPIDGKGFGNGPGSWPHNFSFTTEVHLSFGYDGGEVFTFRGDDDLWIFINRKLAIDLGGLHPELTGTADLDALASKLGMTRGNQYALDIFHAERHTDASHFNLSTTIRCFTPVTPPK